MPTKPKNPQKEMSETSQPRDCFQTPNYATELLIPYIPKDITTIWECSVGHGKIFSVLEKDKYAVYGTDIKQTDYADEVINFLTCEKIPSNVFCRLSTGVTEKLAIITNPPFSLKKRFFEKCIYFDIPFALLLSADYSGWVIDAVRKYGCEKIIPDHRIDYITPTGKSGATGHSSHFHSLWMTRYFNLGKSETFVELTKEMKTNI